LCERLGDTPRLFPVLYGEWVFHVVRADLKSGRRAGEELLRLAQNQNDAAAETVGNRIVGTAEFLRGELPDARRHLERALALYDRSSHRSLAFLFAQDPRVAGLSVLSWALFALGYPAQARAKSDESLADAQELSHRNTLGYALLYGCILAQLYGDWREVGSRADRLVTLATEQGAPHFLAAGKIIQGWELSRGGESQAAALQIRDGISAWLATGAGFLVPYFLSLSAGIAVQSGRANESLELLAEAFERVDKTGEEWFAAELHRLKGETLLTMKERNLAQASFEVAVAVAHQQSARLWELRAATSLARLLVSESSDAEAHTILAPVCRWFVEGFGTPDLKRARGLLDELQPPQ
jgi:predicted ATPase